MLHITAHSSQRANVRFSRSTVARKFRTRFSLKTRFTPAFDQFSASVRNSCVLLRRPETMSPDDIRRWSRFAVQNAPRHALRDIAFERGPTGDTRITVEQSDAAIPIDMRREGKALIVDFLDSALPPQLERRLDVRDFGTAVQAIETYRLGNHVRMKIELEGAADYSAYQVSRQFIISPR